MKTRNVVLGIYATLLGASLLLGIGSATALAQSSTLVVGTNTYPADVIAVQAAVDNFQEVTLSGTFNFGNAGKPPAVTPAGIVYLRNPDTVLKADATTGATILGGGRLHPRVSGWAVLVVEAPGVTISGLNLSGCFGYGIMITTRVSTGTPANYYLAAHLTGNPVIIEGNNISVGTVCVYVYWPGAWSVMIRNNTGTASNFAFSTGVGYVISGAQAFPYIHVMNSEGQPILGTLDISDNSFTQTVGLTNVDGITVAGWPVLATFPAPYNLPDWGDNGPVTIARNTLVLSGTPNSYSYSSGIGIGRQSAGLNHCAILDNTISGGNSLCGINAYPYGRDTLIAGNDLANFAGYFGIVTFSKETAIAQNRFGPGIELVPVALVSVQLGPQVPMPLPVENCVVTDNDYTLTGRTSGCILLGANQDLLFQANASGQFVGVEVKSILIKETHQSFAPGEGGIHLADQFVVASTNGGVGPQNTHDIRIVGLRADECADHSVGDRIKTALTGYKFELPESETLVP